MVIYFDYFGEAVGAILVQFPNHMIVMVSENHFWRFFFECYPLICPIFPLVPWVFGAFWSRRIPIFSQWLQKNLVGWLL